jgi:membrane protein implicated in regulation of membrane protease activity
MTWANFYLVCFLVGFLLSVLSLLLSGLHIQWHLPHAGTHGFHLHLGEGAGHVAAHAAAHAIHGTGHHVGGSDTAISPLNFGTLAAFLAWFGGSGFLLTRYSTFWSVLGLGMAVAIGLVGAGLVFTFIVKLAAHDENLDPLDYDMVGVIGHITSPIRQGGTGEIVYSQEGTRHTSGARSDNGLAVAKGTEVVVTRYEKGIAYVQRWEELSGESTSAGQAEK